MSEGGNTRENGGRGSAPGDRSGFSTRGTARGVAALCELLAPGIRYARSYFAPPCCALHNDVYVPMPHLSMTRFSFAHAFVSRLSRRAVGCDFFSGFLSLSYVVFMACIISFFRITAPLYLKIFVSIDKSRLNK